MENQLKESYSFLKELAQDLRTSEKKNTIIFAHNGVGKTSLSVEFKNVAKENGASDTLYYNAYTEDLFYWDNDLDNDEERVLMFRRESHFFDGFSLPQCRYMGRLWGTGNQVQDTSYTRIPSREATAQGRWIVRD